MHPEIALIEPDIAGNVGTLIRTAACFDVAIHVVEPCGFPLSDKALKRSGMDYADVVRLHRHASRASFIDAMRAEGRRLVLMTTKGATRLDQFAFTPADVILLGSESAGAPADVHDAADARVMIPLHPGRRSLNVAIAGGIALAECLRQTKGFAP